MPGSCEWFAGCMKLKVSQCDRQQQKHMFSWLFWNIVDHNHWSKEEPSPPIVPIGLVAFVLSLLRNNLWGNSSKHVSALENKQKDTSNSKWRTALQNWISCRNIDLKGNFYTKQPEHACHMQKRQKKSVLDGFFQYLYVVLQILSSKIYSFISFIPLRKYHLIES